MKLRERERDSFRSGQSKKCVAVSVCVSAELGVINPSTPWVILVLQSTTECALSNTMPLQERKEGAPWLKLEGAPIPYSMVWVKVRVIEVN